MKKKGEISASDRNLYIIYVVSIVVYVALNIMMMLHHEAWRDEAQAWTIARNLSIQEIIDILPTEGHLLPYFLVLKTWLIMGGTFENIGVISLVFMTVTVGMIFFRAPGPVWVKELLVFSPVFFYYNAVITRCYCIVAFALVLTAIAREKRNSDLRVYCLAVALLLQTHVLVLPLAIMLCVELLFDILTDRIPKRRGIYVVLPVCSLAAALCELYQRNDTAFITFDDIRGNSKLTEWNIMFARMRSIFERVYGNGFIPVTVLIMFIVGLLAVIYFEYIKKSRFLAVAKRELIVGGAGIAGYLMIVAIVRACDHIQMALVFFMIVFFCGWIIAIAIKAETEANIIKIRTERYMLAVVFVALVILSYKKEIEDIRYDYRNYFSNSRGMAQKMIDELPLNATVLIRQSDYEISAPYAYIADKRKDITFWDVNEDAEFKCIIWGKNYPVSNLAEYADHFSENVYFLSSKKNEDMDEPVLVSEYQNMWQENYYLYKMTGNGY